MLTRGHKPLKINDHRGVGDEDAQGITPTPDPVARLVPAPICPEVPPPEPRRGQRLRHDAKLLTPAILPIDHLVAIRRSHIRVAVVRLWYKVPRQWPAPLQRLTDQPPLRLAFLHGFFQLGQIPGRPRAPSQPCDHVRIFTLTRAFCLSASCDRWRNSDNSSSLSSRSLGWRESQIPFRPQ